MKKLLKICLCISAIAIVVQLVDISFTTVKFNITRKYELSLSSILNNGRYEAVVVSRGTYGDSLYILDTRTGNCVHHNNR